MSRPTDKIALVPATIRLPQDVYDAIQALATADSRSFQFIAAKILTDAVTPPEACISYFHDAPAEYAKMGR